ncbi:MAG: flagellar biosynthesis protein FlhF [Pirellulales bacterium]|nr:flagellar biosynthesis protein FlhF [Pirellulales bacterium]
MNVKTFRAASIQEALSVVRRELGPGASVLHAREVRGGWLSWLPGWRRIEVVASDEVQVPSRLEARGANLVAARHDRNDSIAAPAGPSQRDAAPLRAGRVQDQLSELQGMVAALCRTHRRAAVNELPQELFRSYASLIDAEISEELARQLIESLRSSLPEHEWSDDDAVQARLTRLVEREIVVRGPIQPPGGRRHLVALVGPTGVGKTTTIAKLAANFRLREKRRVGLITVDTYRVAAVEQLRTYADIIDLPMEVVSTPREMRAAVERMADLDLVLLDTAGRSPHDEVKIQELRALLHEAQADEVHLVLSCVASASTLTRTAERFAAAAPTSVLLTKLDEATGYGQMLELLRAARLPLSYVTHGQNVPDDIRVAEPQRLARLIIAGCLPVDA